MLPAMKQQKPTCGENIRFLRKKNGLTQAKLGELLDKDASIISTWETGTVSPGVESIFALAALFKVDASYFGGDKYEGSVKTALLPTINEAMDVLEAYKNAPPEKRQAVLTILGKKNDVEN